MFFCLMRCVFMSRWCSGTSVRREFTCSLRNSFYLLCETWLQSSSSQVKQTVAEVTSDPYSHLQLLKLFSANHSPVIIISMCFRWASHLRGPFIWHAEERFVGSAEAGRRDKVEGVSNEISPLQICLVLSSFSVVVDKLPVFRMPVILVKFLYLFPHHRSEQNEYRVNKAAVRRIGDMLCKLW